MDVSVYGFQLSDFDIRTNYYTGWVQKKHEDFTGNLRNFPRVIFYYKEG